MIRRLTIATLVLALAGCGLGGTSFTENADVAPAVLYGAFSDLPQTSSGLAALGLNQSAVRAERVGDNELRLTVPSTEQGSTVTFDLRFDCRETCEKTKLSATMTVPQIRMGSSKVLDQAKVGRLFHTYSQELIKAKEQGSSPLPAAREFASLFDALRMIANPALRDQLKSLASANGEPLPLFGDESGPPAGFGEQAADRGGASPAGGTPRSYKAWAQQAADEDAERHAAQDDN